MIRLVSIFALLAISACQTSPRNAQRTVPQAGQGQFVRPAFLNPAPVQRIPATDACQSQLYQGLIGQSEGAIYIPALPGRKRVIKPAFDEGFNYEPDETFGAQPTLIEIRDFLPGQRLYTPSIRTPGSLVANPDIDLNRLTIELDIEGNVQDIRCG